MPESFGTRLRLQRERQHIALPTIAEQTKINRPLLEALERDDMSCWPGGIFRRAYVRAYAQAIGLEPDVVVREFLGLYPDATEVVATLSSIGPGAERGRSTSRPPTRLWYLLESAVGSISRRGTASRESGVVPEPEKASVAPARSLTRPEPDLGAVAHLCTAFGSAATAGDVVPLLQEAARLLDAVGLIVWIWDPKAARLNPALAHGYSDKVLAHVPALGSDTDNATAAAFRLAQPCVVKGSDLASSALVLPLMTAAGCAGVLAIELPNGREQSTTVRALATIFASQIARFTAPERSAEVADRRLA
jgi:transcriptional regulator with XRE-family HTH domain